MGRRRGGSGGAKPRSGFHRVLRRRIESIPKKSNVIVDELVNHLRSNYRRDYSRIPQKPFSDYVREVLQDSGTPNDAMEDSNDDDGGSTSTPVGKKRRKFDGSRRGDVANNSSSSSSLSSARSSDEEVSTSEEAIYGDKVEPEFDLMKSMLRESLRSKSKERREVSKAVELEIVGNKKVNLESKLGDKIKNDNGGSGGNKINGPMFKDFGGMSGVIDELKMEVMVPLLYPQETGDLGVEPIAGILLHGPPGCGKTKLGHAIANEAGGVPFYKVSATELVSGVSGASEENIRELFSKAYRTTPSIVFIDEIDAIASKRENLHREMERRIVDQLLTCMDESFQLVKSDDGNGNSEASDSPPGYVLVIGATNRQDALDPALRRPGRFDLEIELGVPDESARMEILSVLTRKLKVKDAVDLEKTARATPGFVGADLAELVKKVGRLAMQRILYERRAELSKEPGSEDWWRQPWSHDEKEKFYIRTTDFEEAAKMVQPSSKREGFSAIPNFLNIDLGLDLAAGFLLYGPPGCGKTLIAKAAANEAGANFIHIKGPELLNKYVGESELAVRTIFSRARKCSPCILFFDEVDALTARRGKEEGGVVKGVVNQLLTELAGAEQRRDVYVIGATNRPDVMDEAFLRPGRFGQRLYVSLPSPDERGMMLKALARKKPVDANVDLMALGRDRACENFSGADLSALMDAAAEAAFDEILASPSQSCDGVKRKIEHFKTALEEIRPSVSEKQIKHYKRLAVRFSAK